MDNRRADIRCRVGLGLSVLLAIGTAWAILAQARWIAGPEHWQWHYQTEPSGLGWTLLAGLISAALAWIAWHVRARDTARTLVASLAILAVAATSLRLATAWLFNEEISLRYIDYVVRNPLVGSYFTVGERLIDQSEILQKYPGWMPSMPPHATNKPPGPAMLSIGFIKVFGTDPQAQVAGTVGLMCGLLSLACIPLSYALVRALGASSLAGFHVVALWAMAPGASIFFPLFDPLLTVPALGLSLLWILAISKDRYRWSVAMGCVLAVTLFFTFNILPIGLFIVVVGWFTFDGTWRVRAMRCLRHALVVLAVTTSLQLVLWLTTGLDVVAVFRVAIANQAHQLAMVRRPYPQSIAWDLIDYALGVAWMPVVLAGVYLSRLRRPLRLIDVATLAGIAQLVVVAVSGLLPGETARVWNFMIPLILIPAALELERWPRAWPPIFYGAMACLTALMARSFVFMFAG